MILAKQLFRKLPDDWIFGKYFSLELPVFEWVRAISVALTDFFEKTPKNARIFSEIPPQLYIKGDVYIGKNVSLPPYGYIEDVPLYKFQLYKELLGEMHLPGAEAYYQGCLSIPIYPNLPQEDQDYVLDILAQCCQHL